MINIDLDNAINMTLRALLAYADVCDFDLADIILDLTDDLTDDEDPVYTHLIRACRAYDITPDELMTRTYAITDA
jgi:hypothetical protein